MVGNIYLLKETFSVFLGSFIQIKPSNTKITKLMEMLLPKLVEMLCLAKMTQEFVSLKFRPYLTKRNVICVDRLSLNVTSSDIDICFLPNFL